MTAKPSIESRSPLLTVAAAAVAAFAGPDRTAQMDITEEIAMNRTTYLRRDRTKNRLGANHKRITAEVISCPGQLRDETYCALQINIDGFASPYVLTLALRAVGYKALSEQCDPAAVYGAIAAALNDAQVSVEMAPIHHVKSSVAARLTN